MELKSLHKKENKSSKKIFPIAIGVFVILIMILSVLQLGNNSEDEVKYSGHKFSRVNSMWVVYINNQKIEFYYSPKELEDLNVDIVYGDLLASSKIYLSFDRSQAGLYLPVREFVQNQGYLRISQHLVDACPYDNEECTKQNLPLKNCSNADSSTGIILFELANETKVDFNGSCMVFYGNTEGITKLVDKLVLKSLGVM